MLKQVMGFWLPVLLLLSACNQGEAVSKQATEKPTQTATPQENTANLPKSPASFESAKKILYNDIYKGHNITFYCGCDYDPRSKIVDWQSCGYKPRKNPERASRIEAEHVMPAHQFGNFRQCWREPEKVCPEKKMTGRQCCEAKDPVFETAHNDLHNLFPAVGEVNGDRSNYNWGMVEGNKREYGACPIEVDESIRRAEPPDAVKGDVARVMFYMEDTYGFKLSDQDRKLFSVWSKQDAPDAWEIERNQRIAEKQGKDNRFISEYKTTVSQSKTELKPVIDNKTATEFSCTTKKTCSQMANCAEAKFQLNTCGNTSIDGDGDGKPCASICK
ncbi:endonuclease [Agitococcus lubricus]|uniref:Deoxyribonuclease-1 n=1 Tax=Agitococcus lubricus TaxID=1077255 RepID=A0A2T5IZB9_9GAMM|nr:endonuclease [Agitococcus lubricus]PTQ89388.1 deoxyribonuclease-1 [Agitococcus lubricus]